MNDTKQSGGSASTRRSRTIKVAPMTHAVRMAMAATVAALALGASGSAFAGDCKPSSGTTTTCAVAQGIDIAPVYDLTTIPMFATLAIDQSDSGDVVIDNAAPISVTATGPDPATAIRGYSSGGNVGITNQAGTDLVANSEYGNAVGIYAYAPAGNATVDNSADITAETDYHLAVGIFASGADADVTNSGAIETTALDWTPEAYSVGIEAMGSDSVVVTNSGDISGTVQGFYQIYVYSPATGTGEASINNTGGHAFGIYAAGGAGGATVDNSGDIEMLGDYVTGIEVQSGGDISLSNSGNLAIGDGQHTFVSDDVAGTITATYVGTEIATGINVASNGEGAHVAVSNTGSISANSIFGATGIAAASGGYGGTVSVDNTGDIHASQTHDLLYGAYGVQVTADLDASVDNSGTIDVVSGGMAVGAQVRAFAGDATITNSGDVNIAGGTEGTYSDWSTGLTAVSVFGNAAVYNSGSVTVSNQSTLASSTYAVVAQSQQNVTVHNSGSVYVSGKYATGVAGYSGTRTSRTGDTAIDNSGDIRVIAEINSHDYYGQTLYLGGTARGLMAVGANVEVNNSGSIFAEGNFVEGIWSHAVGDVTIINSGDISVSVIDKANYGAQGIAVHMEGEGAGINTLNNLAGGSIRAEGEGDSRVFAVMDAMSDSVINNNGFIIGAVATFGGVDVFNNANGGVWDVGGARNTNFGDDDDTVNNLAGGTIVLDSAGLYMGGGENNAFNNAGTIKVNGDSLIDMGSGDSGGGYYYLAAAPSLVPSLNALPLVNTGIIDFLDGATDDLLTIVGDLGGNGAINLDLSQLNQASDQLYVDGSMADGAVQTVNLSLDALPSTAHTPVVFARISGDSTAGSFVGGEVIGYSPKDFLDLAVVVSSQIDATNTAADTFAAGIDVAGLNDTGTLAASIASGAAGMLNSQVGTLKQRLGVNPFGDSGKVLSAFFRTYASEGDVRPSHVAANFGQGGNFDYSQRVWGSEVGINANLSDNLHVGVVLGKADGRQRLTQGVGSNRMDGTTVGLYASWFAPQGFYADLSGRWMAVDVDSTSAAGSQQARARTFAVNLEAGYQWELSNGLAIVPQLQYTRTRVEDVRVLGEQADLQSQATSSRGRLGVEVSKVFQSGDIRWTPYASVNAIREFDGDSTFVVADTFTGSTSTKGTSAMAELGVGMQTGRWSFTVGANWMDGGAFKSTVGAQALVRLAW